MGSLTDKLSKINHIATLVIVAALWAPNLSSGILSQRYGTMGDERLKVCDPAMPLDTESKEKLLSRIKNTQAGTEILNEYIEKYGSFDTLVVQWDSVSYSQLSKKLDRVPAGQSKNSNTAVVCIHLSKKLPEIEHVADLVHELVHASRLSQKVLLGEEMAPDEFVQSRIAGRGGEADAFRVECAVKHEILGYWDNLCRPYVRSPAGVDEKTVVDDLYSGTLSASLTGEAYPIMLAKQYKRMLERRSFNGILK